jgi:hypothetical protein
MTIRNLTVPSPTTADPELSERVQASRRSQPELARKTISPHVFRHYLPSRIMSGNAGVSVDLIGKSVSHRVQAPETTRDNFMLPAIDCSGRRGADRQV